MIFTAKVDAQRLALAAWWGNQPTKRKKALRLDSLFLRGPPPVSCSLCWAAQFDHSLFLGWKQQFSKRQSLHDYGVS
jgi:hypothetical protein